MRDWPRLYLRHKDCSQHWCQWIQHHGSSSQFFCNKVVIWTESRPLSVHLSLWIFHFWFHGDLHSITDIKGAQVNSLNQEFGIFKTGNMSKIWVKAIWNEWRRVESKWKKWVLAIAKVTGFLGHLFDLHIGKQNGKNHIFIFAGTWSIIDWFKYNWSEIFCVTTKWNLIYNLWCHFSCHILEWECLKVWSKKT